MTGDGGCDIHQRIPECCVRMQRPCLCRREGRKGSAELLMWERFGPSSVLITFMASPFILMCIQVAPGIKENRAQTNRGNGNSESESSDASRSNLLDSCLDSVASEFGLSLAFCLLRCSIKVPLPILFFLSIQFVPFVCPVGVASGCQRNFPAA